MRTSLGGASALLWLAIQVWSPDVRAQVPAPAAAGQADFPATPAPSAGPAAPTSTEPSTAPADAPAAPAAPADEAPSPAPPLPQPEPKHVARKPTWERYLMAPPEPARLFTSLALGGGFFHASSGSPDDTRTFSGGSVSGQLAIGGRLGKRRVAIGGMYLQDTVVGLSSKDERIDGDEPRLKDIHFTFWALGFFTDVAMQSEPGLHFQGLLGVGSLWVSRATNSTSAPSDPVGFIANLGVGYDLRVGQHFGLGALLRATYAPLDVSETGSGNGTTVATLIPALLLNVTTR